MSYHNFPLACVQSVVSSEPFGINEINTNFKCQLYFLCCDILMITNICCFLSHLSSPICFKHFVCRHVLVWSSQFFCHEVNSIYFFNKSKLVKVQTDYLYCFNLWVFVVLWGIYRPPFWEALSLRGTKWQFPYCLRPPWGGWERSGSFKVPSLDI